MSNYTKGQWSVVDVDGSPLKNIVSDERPNWFVAEGMLEGDARLIVEFKNLLDALAIVLAKGES